MIPAGGYLKQLCFSCHSKLSLGAWTVLPSRSARGRRQHRVMFHLQQTVRVNLMQRPVVMLLLSYSKEKRNT